MLAGKPASRNCNTAEVAVFHWMCRTALLATILVASCAPPPPPARAGGSATVQVRNQSSAAVAVFARAETDPEVRLGSVAGGTTAHLPIPGGAVGTGRSLRLIARGSGGTRGAFEVAEQLPVAPGDTVVLIIPPP
jgi:hypothetical protein